MTPDEAQRILEAIRSECDAKIAELAHEGGATAQAVRIGMSGLKEHLLTAMDFRALAEAEPPQDVAKYQRAIEAHCRNHCRIGFVSPGQAPGCAGCTLRPYAVGAVERQAEIVMAEDPEDQDA
jgi:hypothetical protein